MKQWQNTRLKSEEKSGDNYTLLVLEPGIFLMKYLAHIFILLCFFPYIDLYGLGTDTQPNALIFGLFILFAFDKRKMNTPIILLWVLFGISLLFAFNSQVNLFTTAKIVLNYLSPPVISFAAYTLFTKLNYKVSFGMFLSIVMVYCVVGIVQTYFVDDFMTSLINMGARGVLVGGRGVVSLTSEPSFYGSICLFFMVFSWLNYSRKQNIFIAILMLFQILVLAKSSIAIALILGSLAMFGIVQLFRLRMKYVITFALFLIIGISSKDRIINAVAGSRTGDILHKVLEDPLLIAQVDPSIALRLTGTISPYFVIRHNYFMPMGYGRYKTMLKELNGRGLYKKIITKETLNTYERVVGSINSALFQLGFLGLLLPLAIFLSFKKLLRRDIIIFALILFMSLMFTQIQLMHSMIGLIIASALFQSKLLEKEAQEQKARGTSLTN